MQRATLIEGVFVDFIDIDETIVEEFGACTTRIRRTNDDEAKHSIEIVTDSIVFLFLPSATLRNISHVNLFAIVLDVDV